MRPGAGGPAAATLSTLSTRVVAVPARMPAPARPGQELRRSRLKLLRLRLPAPRSRLAFRGMLKFHWRQPLSESSLSSKHGSTVTLSHGMWPLLHWDQAQVTTVTCRVTQVQVSEPCGVM